MERSEDDDRGGVFSCWGRLKLKLPWRRRRPSTRRNAGSSWEMGKIFKSRRNGRPACGGFKYDPLSYAQNFDEGGFNEDDEDSSHRWFSSRYAASSKSLAAADDNSVSDEK